MATAEWRGVRVPPILVAIIIAGCSAPNAEPPPLFDQASPPTASVLFCDPDDSDAVTLPCGVEHPRDVVIRAHDVVALPNGTMVMVAGTSSAHDFRLSMPSVDPDRPGTARGRNMLLVSHDHGATWAGTPVALPAEAFYALQSSDLPGDLHVVDEKRVVVVAQHEPKSAGTGAQGPGLIYSAVYDVDLKAWEEAVVIAEMPRSSWYTFIVPHGGEWFAIWRDNEQFLRSARSADLRDWHVSAQPVGKGCTSATAPVETSTGVRMLCEGNSLFQSGPPQSFFLPNGAQEWIDGGAFPLADQFGSLDACRNYHIAGDGPRLVAVGLECPENYMSTSDDGGKNWTLATSLTERLRLEDDYPGFQSMSTPCIDGERIHIILRAGEASSRPITDRPLEGFAEVTVVAQLAWPSLQVIHEWLWPGLEEGATAPPAAWATLFSCKEGRVAMIGDGLTRMWAMYPVGS